MAPLNFFPREQIVGVFRGFQEGGLEFHADLILPYRNEFQSVPMHGHFVLVQLETPNEAVLGRIAALSAEGKLAFGSGEEFNIRAVREGRAIPEDLREQYLKYKVNIRVLGVLRNDESGGGMTFVASHRRLPHVGSPVAFPGPEVLREIAGHNGRGAAIGHLAFGEYVYAAGSDQIDVQPWMQMKEPEVLVRFPIESLVSRRTFIFARAGFGKSNLNKLLFSKLYEGTPTVQKRGDRHVPVGTIIFDPDGEYFWPDDRGRPGLCDVPELRDKLVVFTARKAPSPFYESFVAGGIKLDIRRLRPADVIAIALEPERQDQQNVRKLRGLDQQSWTKLVELIDREGLGADPNHVASLLRLDRANQQVEALAARSNMNTIVRMLHDQRSQLMDQLMVALREGKLCVVDASLMRGGQSLILSGLILRTIFNHNQRGFTAAESDTIPTIAVIEEAQSVFNERSAASDPYLAWVKEGRKYDLGAVLVTQQPGSIQTEILSQGDNWFLFHLLSAADLQDVKRANAHFSDDVLSSLLNEPIPGQGVFWSSANEKPYPIAIRALSFEKMYEVLDPQYNLAAVDTYARRLRATYAEATRQAVSMHGNGAVTAASAANGRLNAAEVNIGATTVEVDSGDPYGAIEAAAIDALRHDSRLMQKFDNEGVAWGELNAFFKDHLPPTIAERDEAAYRLVPKALNTVLGDNAWQTYKHPQRNNATYVQRVRRPQ